MGEELVDKVELGLQELEGFRIGIQN